MWEIIEILSEVTRIAFWYGLESVSLFYRHYNTMHPGVKLTEVESHSLPPTSSVTLDTLLIWFSIFSSSNESDPPLCLRVVLVIEKGASCSVG